MACADCTDNRMAGTCSASLAVLTPSFVRTAIFDLIVLCSNRVKLGSGRGLKHPAEPSIKIRDMTGKGQGIGGRDSSEIQGSEVSIPSINFSTLLSRLIRFIAKKRGYENSSLLLVDNCRWLLYEWIKMSCDNHIKEYNDGNNNDNSNSDEDGNGDLIYNKYSNGNNESNIGNLKLEDFPYQILDPYCSSYKQFLTNFGDIILPLICVVENPKKRWALLSGEQNNLELIFMHLRALSTNI